MYGRITTTGGEKAEEKGWKMGTIMEIPKLVVNTIILVVKYRFGYISRKEFIRRVMNDTY